MMWPDVVQAWIARLSGDSILASLIVDGNGNVLTPFIYRSRTRTSIQIPSVVYTVISSTVGENYSPVTIQWDVFALGGKQAADIERRLYELMHFDLPIDISGLRMWSKFLNGLDIHSEDQTVSIRALEYHYTPARQNG